MLTWTQGLAPRIRPPIKTMSLGNEDMSSSATLIGTSNHGTPGHLKRDVEAITSHIHQTKLGEIHRVPSPDWCWSRQTPSFRPALARHAGTWTGPEHAPFDIASAGLPHGQIHPPTQIRMCTESGSMQVPERWRRIWVPARSGRGGWGGDGDLTQPAVVWVVWVVVGINLWNKASIPRFLQTAVSWPSSLVGGPPHFLHGSMANHGR